MMKLNTTLFSNGLWGTLALCSCLAAHAAAPHRYQCPSHLVVGKTKHAFSYATVYDGPPEQLASLEGTDSLEGADVYLVCKYKRTDKVVTIHAVGSKSCNGTEQPPTVFCD